MNKIEILKICIMINFSIMILFALSFIFLNNHQSSYFNIGWSNNFVFISVPINTPFSYFTFCGFIIVSNVSEICMDNVAVPLIQFSTYNPYKKSITDFKRSELEFYSNTIFFIQASKRLLQIFIILSQIDIALISLISSQLSASIAINYLLNQKNFMSESYVEIPSNVYGSIHNI